MIQWKKVACATMAVCALASACASGAVEPAKTDASVLAAVGSGGTDIEPMADQLVINRAITKKSESWAQMTGYASYRVWVENTTKVQMKVTIKSSSANDSHVFYVPAGGSKTYTVNNAVSGVHTISFDVGSTALSGTVRVRVANVALS